MHLASPCAVWHPLHVFTHLIAKKCFHYYNFHFREGEIKVHGSYVTGPKLQCCQQWRKSVNPRSQLCLLSTTQNY